ncbi:hypothetical protein DPMN_075510 [Dreissena polymorpha]|uniref:Uncharacterized protein n=1 Tax=Dreissena polymorpha TaxID=45954 RepID=A0A9D4BMQ9_DREPO|nr:hypothetical protein DPMN_075510 [Dreissena polymorpha]
MTLYTDRTCRPSYYKPSFLLLNLIHRPLTFRNHTQLYLCSLLILCSGDVHPNPGPDSSSSSSLSEYSHILNNNGLSIMHLNIQSLRPKFDILEVEAHPYDVLVLTETWLNPSIPDDDIALLHFQQPAGLGLVCLPLHQYLLNKCHYHVKVINLCSNQ